MIDKLHLLAVGCKNEFGGKTVLAVIRLLTFLFAVHFVAGYHNDDTADGCPAALNYPFVSLKDKLCNVERSPLEKRSENTMGTVLYWLNDVNQMSNEDVLRLRNDVSKHGVVIIKKQRMTRYQQEVFTAKLGEIIVLPSSFQGERQF